MADSKTKRGGNDRALIALSEAYEVRYWSKKFKVTPARLKSAVKAVGHSAKKVEAHLKADKARDRKLIALSQPYEVKYWSNKFKVTPARLRSAVKAAGRSAAKVGAYLAGAKKTKKKKKAGASKTRRAKR
jgi:hypothetical protein